MMSVASRSRSSGRRAPARDRERAICAWGLTDEEILALPGYQASPLFSELDKLVLDHAVGMTSRNADLARRLWDSSARLTHTDFGAPTTGTAAAFR
jgi:hypothetical protein